MTHQLVSFLLEHREQLWQWPLKGDLALIKCVYPGPDFEAVLDDFNAISHSILFDNGPRGRRITYVNIENVKTFQKLAAGAPVAETLLVVKPMKLLQQILDAPLRTAERGGEFDQEQLQRFLARPTASVELSRQKAQGDFKQLPFYQVCETASHGQQLAKLCFASRFVGQSVQEMPANAKLHRVIAGLQVSKETQQCVRSKVHYLPVVTSNTDSSLGNCLYLDTCHKLKNCRYLHFYTLNPKPTAARTVECAAEYTIGDVHRGHAAVPAQWINCDVRLLPFSVLGKFAAIILDPAWDIHMSLPYGTCRDTELLQLPVQELQDEGLIFLWVTGRLIETGRRALAQWGYTVSDEMIWIKINQLRRTIVTGRTGHWLNHLKEHLLVGVKGNPVWLSRKVDLDFIVSSTRETLRKPDELYGIVERLVGRHARKLEMFGRDHNVRPGWFSTYICN